MLLFSADAKLFQISIFFCLQKVEKNTTKSCILMAVERFFLCSPDCPKQPRTSFPFYKFFYPTISDRISGGTHTAKRKKKMQIFPFFLPILKPLQWTLGRL